MNSPAYWRRRRENINDDKGKGTNQDRRDPGVASLASTASNRKEMKALLERELGFLPATPPRLLPVASQKLKLDHSFQDVIPGEGDDISEAT